MNNHKVIIPFVELIKRSAHYVLFNFSFLVRLLALPVLILAGMQLWARDYNTSVQLVLLFLSSFVGVSCCRRIILNEQSRFSAAMLGYTLRYLLTYLLLSLLLFGPGILVLMGVYVFGGAAQQEQFAALASGKIGMEDAAGILIWPLIAIIVSSVFCARLRIALAASAVGDREVGLKTAFLISRGNTWRLCGGLILLSLPIQILTMLTIRIFSVIPAAGIFAGVVWGFVDVCFKASFDAHAYQYFIYFYHKQIEDAEDSAARNLVEDEIKRRRD